MSLRERKEVQEVLPGQGEHRAADSSSERMKAKSR